MKKQRKKKTIYGTEMGFKQALNYVLSVLCYAYYVKADNLVSDIAFDELEKIWKDLYNVNACNNRGHERDECYSNGVRVNYYLIKKAQRNEKKS